MPLSYDSFYNFLRLNAHANGLLWLLIIKKRVGIILQQTHFTTTKSICNQNIVYNERLWIGLLNVELVFIYDQVYDPVPLGKTKI